MAELGTLKNIVREEFSFLADYNFVDSMTDGHASFIALYTKQDLPVAVECRVNIRELTTSLFIVRLNEGQMPSGFYVDSGRPCRTYLSELVKEHEWNVPAEAWKRLSSPSRKKTRHRSEADAIARIKDLAVVLRCVIEIIVEAGISLFPDE